MTLLEALAALVILGSTAVGFLELFHSNARLARDAGDWAQVTAYAESVMETTKLGGARGDEPTAAPRGTSATIDTRAWAPGVNEVIVVVTSANGHRFELHRLTRESSAAPGS